MKDVKKDKPSFHHTWRMIMEGKYLQYNTRQIIDLMLSESIFIEDCHKTPEEFVTKYLDEWMTRDEKIKAEDNTVEDEVLYSKLVKDFTLLLRTKYNL